MILNMVGGGGDAGGGFPIFTYTGMYQLIDDGKVSGKQNWRIKFFTSGTLTFKNYNGSIDAFLVAGGSGGHGGGGGGGTTGTLKSVKVVANTAYPIVIGAGGPPSNAGGATSAFNLTKDGGTINTLGEGAFGGTGGNFGGNGAWYNAAGNGGSDGVGTGAQGYTTKEFGEITGTQYAGGGGGGTDTGTPGKGGEGGGADGSARRAQAPSAAANTGGGGGGCAFGQSPGYGGSGIVIIRNAR